MKPYYTLDGNGWFIFWHGLISKWIISAVLGDDSAPSWQRTGTGIEGVYDPSSPATGIATVAEI